MFRTLNRILFAVLVTFFVRKVQSDWQVRKICIEIFLVKFFEHEGQSCLRFIAG